MDVQPEGYGVDKKFPEIIYVPHDAHFDLQKQTVSWPHGDGERAHQIAAGQNLRPPFRLQGAHGKTAGREPRVAARRHGGGRPALPQALHGFRRRQIGNFQTHHRRHSDRAGVCRRFEKGFRPRGGIDPSRLLRPFSRPDETRIRAQCWRRNARSARSSNCSRRTTREFTPEYNAWVETIPQYIKELVFVVKRYYKPEWGDDWRRPFQRGHHQRHARQRIEMRQPQARHDLPARRL